MILKFRSVNFLGTSRPSKNNYQKYLCSVALKNICSEMFLQTMIKGSVTELIFSKIPCFQHILLDTFRQMRLKHENYSLRGILF